ncbi:hypothetical protein GLE_0858 [Lysobacter enzymogenes]|uniref:Uncharacterized protein n=1 Tax=Lysobacter enzymogenes TaxID=69 RepID=A0A0S2DCZ9_LYSEN|nr:hypothetical protein [Lysobacter enzymogenes]ALN56216.1 hypothetical protein GLE_0858 [Lysobacter enzymogenes]QCW25119.1 hypothetical protein FE772_04955 [Lysobacter enzymogenes]
MPGSFATPSIPDDAHSRRWYSRHLAAAAEPSLSCGGSARGYRFTWLRSFHHPVIVRVSAQAGVEAVELDGAGGYEPGAVLRRSRAPLTAVQLQALRAAFDALDAAPATQDRNTLDGAEWILERRDASDHRVWVRTSPRDGALHVLGQDMLRLSGWTFPDPQTY